MARLKNDGRGRLGGRTVGTPNKDKPLKYQLKSHSVGYFTPSIIELDNTGSPTGRIISPFEADLKELSPTDRVEAELKLLKFHTPQMQSSSVDMSMQENKITFTQRLTALCKGDKFNLDDEDD